MRCSPTPSPCTYTLLNPRFPDTNECLSSKEIGDIAYEVDCANIIIKEGDVDIGGSSSVMLACVVLTSLVRR